MKYITTYLILLFLSFSAMSQNAQIEGRILNEANNEPIPFSNIQITGQSIGSTSDFEGRFIITGIEPGFYSLTVSSLGFETIITEEFQVIQSKTPILDIKLRETALTIDEVKITASRFRKVEEAPVSMLSLGIREIETSPGANRDISKVLQTLPGIAVLPGPGRNDIIVRGGSSNESRFFLDEVEIPNLNHFATQGASGGTNSIINSDFIREVEFFSGAFPANRGNALSGVFNFKQIEGNSEKLKLRGTLGASETALTIDGPIKDNTTFILSARRSYLQFLFQAIGLPFLPTFNDYQFKSKTRFNDKNELTIVSIGSLDHNRLSTGIKNPDDFQSYILGYLPESEQWSYTIGGVYKHYREKGYHTVVLSRNMLDNGYYKYAGNIEAENNLISDYSSRETENRFRYENTIRYGNSLKLNYGASFDQVKYSNDTYIKLFSGTTAVPLSYSSELEFYKYGVFSQVSKKLVSERLSLSLGVRLDGNSYNKEMQNPLNQVSPRFSASFLLTEKLSVNFNTGRYYQLPPYTSLGYRDNNDRLVNKDNGIKYIQADHIIGGFAYNLSAASRFTIEGFYKAYENYPFSTLDSISLAFRPADFGTFGDEPLVSSSTGRAYGFEVLYQAMLMESLSVLASYTFSKSEFYNKFNNWSPTSWDNQHILIIVASKKFKKGWNAGLKWRFAGGLPYTPYDLETSELVTAWNVRNQPYIDYNQVNSMRFREFHQLDIRIDKSFYFKKSSLKVYVDVQNLYNYKSESQDIYTNTDINGNVTINPDDPNRYILRKIENPGGGTVLPTIGIIFDF